MNWLPKVVFVLFWTVVLSGSTTNGVSACGQYLTKNAPQKENDATSLPVITLENSNRTPIILTCSGHFPVPGISIELTELTNISPYLKFKPVYKNIKTDNLIKLQDPGLQAMTATCYCPMGPHLQLNAAAWDLANDLHFSDEACEFLDGVMVIKRRRL